jgi:4-amino-4-deoxy-L-arabinose transferase-like glycosyltransferase
MVGAPVLLGEGLDAPGVTPPASRVFDGLAVGALALAALLVYAHDLGGTPAYLHHDEIFFAVQADAIASNAHDTNGRLLPVYFQVYSNLWYQPLPVYFTALLLQALPISEASVRLPAAIVGAIDVVLLYLVARRLFTSRVLALVAAGLLALAPAHFIFSRLAIDPLYPVPFVLAWLLGLAVFFERSNPWMLFFATTSLGVGFYSYMASVVMMPMYLAITCGALWAVRDQRLTRCAVAIAGFAWPVVLSVPFHLAHPDFLTDQLARYGPAGATAALDPLQRIS